MIDISNQPSTSRQMVCKGRGIHVWRASMVTHSGPSSVCRQLRLSGTMLSSAMSISGYGTIPGPHRPRLSTIVTARARYYGRNAYLAEHLGFRHNGQVLFGRSAVGIAPTIYSPESKLSLMVSAADVCWLQRFPRISVVCEKGTPPEALRRLDLYKLGAHT